MKLGCGTLTWAFAGEDLPTALREIAGLGIRYVDVLGCLHGDPAKLGAEQKHEIKKVMADRDLVASSLLAVDAHANIAAENAREREAAWDYARAIVEFARFLETRQVLFKPGDKQIDVPNERAWTNAVLFSQELADLCADADLFLTFELEWRTCGLVQTIAQLEGLLAEVDRPTALANIDLGHVALARDGVEELRRIAAKTIHLHLNDNDTFVHTNDIPGMGSVPFQSYISAIAAGAESAAEEAGEVLVAAIEVEQPAGSPLSPYDACEQSRDWVLANIPEIEL